jgi:ankyrin repeat protein
MNFTMSLESFLLGAFETHSPDEIREALKAGASPIEAIKGKRPIDCLIEAYFRSPRFADCLRVMIDAGADVGDPLLEAVLLDDDAALRSIVNASPPELQRKVSPLCAYTSCRGVSALHICAEFNSLRCARVLIDVGADVNARADVDADGIGGQTPIFHTVNSNQNYCRPMMELLAESGADLEVRLKGLVWGAEFEWETLLFDVTVFSYAQCGLYAQFQRREKDIYGNLAYLYRKRYGSEAPVRNVPNKYLFP